MPSVLTSFPVRALAATACALVLAPAARADDPPVQAAFTCAQLDGFSQPSSTGSALTVNYAPVLAGSRVTVAVVGAGSTPATQASLSFEVDGAPVFTGSAPVSLNANSTLSAFFNFMTPSATPSALHAAVSSAQPGGASYSIQFACEPPAGSPASASPVPTLGEWALALLALACAALGLGKMRSRTGAPTLP